MNDTKSMSAGKTYRLTEAEFQVKVIDAAKRMGWYVVHIPAVEVREGQFVTPYQGDAGLPDLILARDGVVILAELKTDTGRPTADQKAWLGAAGQQGRLWRPMHWELILDDLRNLKRPPLWGGNTHPFAADESGQSCSSCGLPAKNQRHGSRVA